MSIKPHPTLPGVYYVIERPEGYKSKQKYHKVAGYEAAVDLDNDLKAQKCKPVETPQPRLKDIVTEYMEWAARNLSEASQHNKKNRLHRYIIPFFGEYRVKDLTQAILDAYAAKHTRAIYRVDLAHLMALIKWMQRRNLAPLLSFHPESVPVPARVKTVPAPDDIVRFINAFEIEWHRIVLWLLFIGGLRWSEAVKLRWECVDAHAGIIRLAESATEKEDVIAIPPMVQGWMETNRKDEGYVFPGRRPGTHMLRFSRIMDQKCRETGLKINPHLLRHAHGTYVYQETGDIYAVQQSLRHSKISTSQIYTRFSVAQKRKAMVALVNLVQQHTPV